MNFEQKMLKYKKKYINLKKHFGGGNKNTIIGINYEGGKIIQHVLQNNKCVAYANVQIAMDAPFMGRVASVDVRSKRRSEIQFDPDADTRIILGLNKLFNIIELKYQNYPIVIQIARGRAAEQMKEEVIIPFLKSRNIKLENIIFNNGYRQENYYNHINENEYIFINIGMFAVLQDESNFEQTKDNLLKVGEVCNPNITCNITSYENDEFTISQCYEFNDDKNLLNFIDFPKLLLYGIADKMPFITPLQYSNNAINKLISSYV